MTKPTVEGVLADVIDAHAGRSDEQFDRAYAAHNAWLKRLGAHPVELARSELTGHDLACWCPLDRKCHADILLAMAH